MKVIAHRGASAQAPENTLAAMRLALALGADGLEVDVHLTRDHRLAVLHDPDTRRTAPTHPPWRAAASTLAELQQLDAGGWKAPAFAGERIPALEEVLALLPSRGEIFIELKSGAAGGLLEALERAFAPPGRAAFPAERAVVMSFHPDLTRALKPLRPHWRVLQLLDQRPSAPALRQLLDDVRAGRLNGLGQNRRWVLPPAEYAALRAAGATLSVWTVNNPADAPVWRERGFDYLTTDAPDLIRRALADRGG